MRETVMAVVVAAVVALAATAKLAGSNY